MALRSEYILVKNDDMWVICRKGVCGYYVSMVSTKNRDYALDIVADIMHDTKGGRK